MQQLSFQALAVPIPLFTLWTIKAQTGVKPSKTLHPKVLEFTSQSCKEKFANLLKHGSSFYEDIILHKRSE